MKTSLRKLQKFAALRHDRRAQKHHQSLALDELARATQDMNDMRDCYDRLLSAAAATANSVYGKVLLMLGKVQFELQKLVDGYRSHIFQTITIPSESLLNELRIVEEMKKRCDGKREIYEDLMKKQKERGRLRNSKGECFNSPLLQEAHDEYDEEANVFVFRMKSLKQGQSRSFLTQASRHHAAQLYFFKKALRSLEAIEPHVRMLAEQLHIDYQFSGLKDDGHDIYDDDDESDGDDETEDGSETHDEGELSFDYGQNGPVQDVSSSKNSMEEILQSPGRNSFSFQRGPRVISKSAPLFPEKKLDSAERVKQFGSSASRKFTSYVLPTPDEARSPVSGKLLNETCNLCTEESNTTTKATPLPPPLTEGLSFKQFDQNVASHAKKAKRQAFSGPLTGNPWPHSRNFTASGPVVSSAFPPPFSGSLLRTPLPHPASTPKLSSRVSPTFVSSPKISELHELPRPPAHLAARRPSNRGAHSGPLISQSHELSTACVSTTSTAASALTMTPQSLPRSYSIPAGGSIEAALHVPLEGSQDLKMAEDISSPVQPASPTS
ncbi:UNVERIFIED_CONTAM: hypothetical protein Slati_3183800 [Sesamum latifolium]|uniref:Hydroxyproline-rich glycoprotein family protein n=1 Tax=Sesamum latifolium TaxID=2727402 RepID=A0AAW2UX18_9LAMI